MHTGCTWLVHRKCLCFIFIYIYYIYMKNRLVDKRRSDNTKHILGVQVTRPAGTNCAEGWKKLGRSWLIDCWLNKKVIYYWMLINVCANRYLPINVPPYVGVRTRSHILFKCGIQHWRKCNQSKWRHLRRRWWRHKIVRVYCWCAKLYSLCSEIDSTSTSVSSILFSRMTAAIDRFQSHRYSQTSWSMPIR